MEGELDLDALIRKQKHQKRYKHTEHRAKHKHIHKNSENSGDERKKAKAFSSAQELNRGIGLMISGFLPDISVQDVYNILQGKPVQQIRLLLKSQTSPITLQKDNNLEVYVKFLHKTDAQAFVNDYADKLLDEKHKLTFQYRP